jgi:hypothetical protein
VPLCARTSLHFTHRTTSTTAHLPPALHTIHAFEVGGSLSCPASLVLYPPLLCQLSQYVTYAHCTCLHLSLHSFMQVCSTVHMPCFQGSHTLSCSAGVHGLKTITAAAAAATTSTCTVLHGTAATTEVFLLCCVPKCNCHHTARWASNQPRWLCYAPALSLQGASLVLAYRCILHR